MADKKQTEVKLRSSMLTDVGVVRDHNEDSAFVDEKLRFFVVADGMGGHAAGEVASAMAVQGIRNALEAADEDFQSHLAEPTEASRQRIAEILEEAVREAHRGVFERGVAEPDKQGMGTTLDVLLVCGQEAFIAHVGDSRTYLMRGDSAAQITTDHTVAEVLVIEGKLSAEEALVSPLRTILVNALGVAAEVGVEMAHLTLQKGDRVLICSDGLHDYFPKEQELFTEVTGNAPEAALAKLIEAAKERGGHDNITAVIVEVVDAPPVAEPKTAPVPVMRATSDGIPHAVSKDDTVPVDSRADTPVPAGASKAGTEGSDGATGDEETEAPPDEMSEQDFRSTVPIRVSQGKRSKTEEGMGDGSTFSGETTLEIDPVDD